MRSRLAALWACLRARCTTRARGCRRGARRAWSSSRSAARFGWSRAVVTGTTYGGQPCRGSPVRGRARVVGAAWWVRRGGCGVMGVGWPAGPVPCRHGHPLPLLSPFLATDRGAGHFVGWRGSSTAVARLVLGAEGKPCSARNVVPSRTAAPSVPDAAPRWARRQSPSPFHRARRRAHHRARHRTRPRAPTRLRPSPRRFRSPDLLLFQGLPPGRPPPLLPPRAVEAAASPSR